MKAGKVTFSNNKQTKKIRNRMCTTTTAFFKEANSSSVYHTYTIKSVTFVGYFQKKTMVPAKGE